MVLTFDVLKDIKYFVHTTKTNASGMYDIFKIYYKPWWRFHKTIKVRREVTQIDGDITTHTPSPYAQSIYQQLHLAVNLDDNETLRSALLELPTFGE